MPPEQEQAEAPEVNLADLQDQQDLQESEAQPEIEAQQQEEQAAPAPEPEPEEITVMIGDEPVEEKTEAAPWVRELRKKNREDQKRIRELEAKLASQTPQPTLTKKPILEEFDYDTDKYEEALAHWIERKKHYDYALEAKKREEEEQNQNWQQKLESYADAKTSLKVKDFEDAEATVAEMLNVTQQGVMIQGAENPALLVYALGKNPKKAKELASITDPVKFAFAIAKLETQLKVTGKRTPPPPEKTVGGTAPIRGAVDSNLDRLREEAARTGDYSKVYAYKKQKRA